MALATSFQTIGPIAFSLTKYSFFQDLLHPKLRRERKIAKALKDLEQKQNNSKDEQIQAHSKQTPPKYTITNLLAQQHRAKLKSKWPKEIFPIPEQYKLFWLYGMHHINIR